MKNKLYVIFNSIFKLTKLKQNPASSNNQIVHLPTATGEKASKDDIQNRTKKHVLSDPNFFPKCK